jgi:hypothetical protein
MNQLQIRRKFLLTSLSRSKSLKLLCAFAVLLSVLYVADARIKEFKRMICGGGECAETAGITTYSDECDGGVVTLIVDCDCNSRILKTGMSVMGAPGSAPTFPTNFEALVDSSMGLSPGAISYAYVYDVYSNPVPLYMTTNTEEAYISSVLLVDPTLEYTCID